MERMIGIFKAWWADFKLTSEERWLAQATDVVELESRLRELSLRTNSLLPTHHRWNHTGGLT